MRLHQLVALILGFFCVSGWPGVTNLRAETNAVLPLQAKANIDQRLFLMNYIDETYRAWPDRVGAAWLVDRRLLTKHLYEYVKRNQFDAELVEIFADCDRLFEAQANYLEDIGAVQKGQIAQALHDRERSIGTTLLASGIEVGARAMAGASLQAAAYGAVPGLVIGGGLLVISEWLAEAERDAARKAEIARFKHRFDTASRAVFERYLKNVDELTQRRKWKAKEAGFPTPEAQNIVNLAGVRPRDPFVLGRVAEIEVKDANSAARLADAHHGIEAACMVPADATFDTFRVYFLRLARSRALDAAKCAWFEAGCSYPVTCAREVVLIANTCKNREVDTTGMGEYEHALILGYAGQHQRALQSFANCRKTFDRDAGFAYNYACQLSMYGSVDTALEWLRYSFQLTGSEVAWSYLDPDLHSVRQLRRNEFLAATRVSSTFDVVLGFTYDQIKLTNTAAFPLTNPKLDVNAKFGTAAWSKSVQTQLLTRGSTQYWDLGFREVTVRESNWKLSGSLICDQSEPIVPTIVKIETGSIAAASGLQTGDQLVYIGREPVWHRATDEPAKLKDILAKYPNQTTTLLVLRQHQPTTIKVKVPPGQLLGITFDLRPKIYDMISVISK